ncbi:hypothetical protein EON65_14545 [archaeon]|nr:MAG: hypothetical protein EON65_14545 [archaeon]
MTTISPSALLLASLDCSQAEISTAESQDKIKLAVYLALAMKEQISLLEGEYVRLLDNQSRLLRKGLRVGPLRMSMQYSNGNVKSSHLSDSNIDLI